MGLYICLKLNISLVVYVLMATEIYSLKANLVSLTESQLFFPGSRHCVSNYVAMRPAITLATDDVCFNSCGIT